jgi:hypothetical protein
MHQKIKFKANSASQLQHVQKSEIRTKVQYHYPRTSIKREKNTGGQPLRRRDGCQLNQDSNRDSLNSDKRKDKSFLKATAWILKYHIVKARYALKAYDFVPIAYTATYMKSSRDQVNYEQRFRGFYPCLAEVHQA